MRQGALSLQGASCAYWRRAFTLLEMCMVLFIIMLLVAVMMPAIQSAFVEQAVRGDSRQLSLMVKTAMLRSVEQHRPYVIDLTSTTMFLHPADATAKDGAAGESGASDKSGNDEGTIVRRLDRANKLLIPDPEKTGAWMEMPATSWLFRVGELCPASRVRAARGRAWVELSFNALTGNVEDESANFP